MIFLFRNGYKQAILSIKVFFFNNLILCNAVFSQENSNSAIAGPYLGHKTLGLIPIPLATIATKNYGFGELFNPDTTEFYLIRNVGQSEKSTCLVFKISTINNLI